jgi:hypothetical protein
MVGKLRQAAEQRLIAEREYRECLAEWAAFDMDAHADEILRQARVDAERSLVKAVSSA